MGRAEGEKRKGKCCFRSRDQPMQQHYGTLMLQFVAHYILWKGFEGAFMYAFSSSMLQELLIYYKGRHTNKTLFPWLRQKILARLVATYALRLCFSNTPSVPTRILCATLARTSPLTWEISLSLLSSPRKRDASVGN